MRLKIVSLMGALLLATACSSSQNAAGTAGQGGLGTAGTAVPGSQQDLAQNIGDRVFFAFDAFDLSPEAQATLTKQSGWLQQYQNVAVTVEGHADERGTREYNLALGDRRANSVRNYLIANGVAPSRISTISYGKERPAVPGNDESAWAQNRRAVTVVN
ncbi:peptidoglycan-associated lipoprotein Pal [Inquilinus limosus]|uniref:peptidoglycan-associated lipoprotein Pal n=1 Tax=Inquilinus limosus TaxID=171674 RepID=UPI00047EE147|nr:peptidoglycan-associated lipoprotein Pal [Inquilinus limosus]